MVRQMFYFTSTISNYNEGLRVEWAKSLARAERWEEEILLLREEMRRTLVFLDYQGQWWRKQGTLRTDHDEVLSSGLRGYAEKQATLRRRLGNEFASIWLGGISDCKLAPPITWPAHYLVAVSVAKKVKPQLERNKMRARVLNYVEDSQ